jgi:hypothetical protein
MLQWLRSGSDPRGVLYKFLKQRIGSALKNYYMQSFLEFPTGILNHFGIQVAVLLLKLPHGGFRIETAVAQPLPIPQRTQASGPVHVGAFWFPQDRLNRTFSILVA